MVSSSSSSSSLLSCWMYDVFLNFKGETRRSFTDHLYTDLSQAGVNTFRDNKGIRKGENISAELLKAIEGSRISIIVFSKKYARSRWCLDELVKILECKQKLKQIVLPIFYNVDPSDIRKHIGEFGDALTKHRERFGDQTVDEWKTALTVAASLSGWDLHNMTNGYESRVIKKITEEVLKELNHTYMNVAKYPIGIDSGVKDILRLLQSQTKDDVGLIGIFGKGGIGKTTLAKAIYNLLFQRFEGSCFLANIRSKVVDNGHDGLVRLQEKLLCKTLKRKKFEIDNVDEGISLMKLRLQSKRVLIVLDDIDHISQLDSLAGQRDWFGLGSAIIITTRNGHLLSELGEHEKYAVKMLSIDESLELLSWHAFGVPVPPEDYIELSEKIVSYTGGLPLALTALGSHLRGRSLQEWSDELVKLYLTCYNRRVKELPSKSFEMVRLEHWLSLVEFPIDLGKLEQLIPLEALFMSENYRHEVDHPILSSLRYLQFNLNHLQSSPSSLYNLLEDVSINSSVMLDKIGDISNLIRLETVRIGNDKSLVELPGGPDSLDSLQSLIITTNCLALTMLLIESCFQAYSEGYGVNNMRLQAIGNSICCSIPIHLRHKCFREVNVCRHESKKSYFEVPIKVEEEMEVFATFHSSKILCLWVSDRNKDDQVCFFPSTKGFLEFDGISSKSSRAQKHPQNERLKIEILPVSTTVHVEHINDLTRRRHRRSCIWEFLLVCFCLDV